ncbi:MAG TPA: TIGR04211 family SH3 domain-containing protein [Candidatus Competibacteraceae bacterium]|nr:TIGR04211 family SH3 domain-containing protein [Candidatus Competibacteraceae bacterium]
MKKLLFLGLLLAPLLVQAQNATRYISDNLEVPMRAGTSTRFKIVKMLTSGTPVEVLQTNAEEGYSLVRTGGVQGWVLTRYLMDTPSARDSLASAQAAVAPLQQENDGLRQSIEQLKAEKQALETRQNQLVADNQRLSQELAQIRKAAANAIAIDTQNKQLQERTVDLESQLQMLQQENQVLRDSSAQARFLTGAGVLFGGILLGLILPRLRPQKRSRWGDL